MCQCINQFSFLFLTRTLRAALNYLAQLGWFWLFNTQMRHDMEKHIPFYMNLKLLMCKLCLPIWCILWKIDTTFLFFLKVSSASSLSPPPFFFIVMYFLARAELKSKYLVDIVTTQIKAHQHNNEMISAYSLSLQMSVSLICWDSESLLCNTLEIICSCSNTHNFRKHKDIVWIVYSFIIRVLLWGYWWWKTYPMSCSGSPHQPIQTPVRCRDTFRSSLNSQPNSWQLSLVNQSLDFLCYPFKVIQIVFLSTNVSLSRLLWFHCIFKLIPTNSDPPVFVNTQQVVLFTYITTSGLRYVFWQGCWELKPTNVRLWLCHVGWYWINSNLPMVSVGEYFWLRSDTSGCW